MRPQGEGFKAKEGMRHLDRPVMNQVKSEKIGAAPSKKP
jgi:hypothetical protein